MALVPQQLSDLRQGRARSEKLGSETVSEDMGAAVCATFDSNAIESGLGDHGDRTSGSKADVWRECADEQPSARRLWAAIAQICNNGRANVWRYRHPCTLSALGANEYLAGAPVDIIERERRHLVGSQADPYLDGPSAHRLYRAVGSKDKQIAVFVDGYHGWDLLEDAPYRKQVRALILGWIKARS